MFYGFYIGRRGYLAYTFVKDQTKRQNESAVGVEVRNNTLYVPITQLVEYKTFNFGVTGSTPVGDTKYFLVAQLDRAFVF